MTNNLIGRQIRVVVAALSFLLSAGSAFAESVRVVVEGATIWRTPTGTGGIIEVVKAGTVLDVRGRQGRWVIVESSTDVRQIGYILAAQTEPVAAGPNTRQPPAAQTLPPGGRSPLPQTRAQAPPPRRLPGYACHWAGRRERDGFRTGPRAGRSESAILFLRSPWIRSGELDHRHVRCRLRLNG